MNPIIAQKAVIENNGKLLVLHRAKNYSAFPDLWDFPGGKLEPDEELIESLKREVKEETNLSIDVEDKISEDDAESNGRPVHFIIYTANILNGKVKLSQDHSEFKWATPDEILKLNTMPYMQNLLRIYSVI